MATVSKPVGYECEFVDQVPEDYFCKQCKHVAREPNITTCCGEIICKACVDVITQDKKPCPSCESNDIKALGLHVKYQRKILALEVCCTMKDRGCPWIGQLQHLNAHLEVTTGDCQYVDVECPKECDQKVQKRNVDTHLANECPNRDYRCPHCNFTDTYRVVTKLHWSVCSYYPLACPNRCGVTFERNDLEDHMKMCRLEEVQCVFSDAGCEGKFIRDNQDEHMDQNIQEHLALMVATTLRTRQDFEQKLQEQQEMFEKKMNEQKEEYKQLIGKKDKQFKQVQQIFENKMKEKDEQIKTLQSQIQEITHHVQLRFPPYYFTLCNYHEEKAWGKSIDSPPMYTHAGGYKFRLRICPNGLDDTHVAVQVYSVKGDHDAVLKFPAQFTITLQLLNQHRDQDHYTRDTQCKVSRENIGDIFLYIGVDYTFIPHAALEWNRAKQTQYLRDNCLRLRITKIVVH